MDTAKRRVARSCRVEVIADAPIASVWRVVADVTRTGGLRSRVSLVAVSQPQPGMG
jgi:hypothetical protein